MDWLHTYGECERVLKKRLKAVHEVMLLRNLTAPNTAQSVKASASKPLNAVNPSEEEPGASLAKDDAVNDSENAGIVPIPLCIYQTATRACINHSPVQLNSVTSVYSSLKARRAPTAPGAGDITIQIHHTSQDQDVLVE